MSTLVLRRLGLGAVTLLLVSVLVFGATQALPGDAASAMLGREATPERLAALRLHLRLDEPVWRQYLGWLGGMLHGDFGASLATEQPVAALLAPRIGNSAFLVLLAALVAIPASLAIGMIGAVRRDGAVDHVLSNVSLALAALPEFIIGIALVMLFATQVMHVLPAVAMIADDEPIWRQWDQAVLPSLALILAVVPYMGRTVRGSMVEVLESEYVAMARLKGMPQHRVMLRHALPNAVVPFVQVTALQLAWLAGGVVVVEFVFRYPGMGQTLVDAVANRDLPVVQALSLLIGGVYVVLNTLADIATVMLTPRLRTALS